MIEPTPETYPKPGQRGTANMAFSQPVAFADAGGIPADPNEMTKEEQAEARKQWRTSKCTWCGGLHLRACPRVKKFEFGNDGKTVTSVEFWQSMWWPDKDVVWPEEMGWEDDDGSPFDSAADDPAPAG